MEVVLLQKVDILSQVPHGEEALELDEVMLGNDTIGVRHYAFDDKVFDGHFNLVPGTRLLEAALQTSMFVPSDVDLSREDIALEVTKARFRAPVKRGDTIKYYVDRVANLGVFCKYKAKAYNQHNVLVMTCEFLCR